jgi:hypothetical protein
MLFIIEVIPYFAILVVHFYNFRGTVQHETERMTNLVSSKLSQNSIELGGLLESNDLRT